MGLNSLNYIIHLLSSLANCKATNGITGKIQFRNPLHMLNAQICICAALVNTPKHLLGVHCVRQCIQACIFRLAALQPPVSSVNTLLYILSRGRIFNTFVECHANIGTQVGLNLHTLFRSHKNFTTVNMGGKIDTLLLDLSQTGKTKHLESTGVCENRAIPGHELMQTTHLFHELVTGPQVEVVGVGKFYLTSDVL